jgi:cytoskeletal protein CcmA (bactofilin family)
MLLKKHKKESPHSPLVANTSNNVSIINKELTVDGAVSTTGKLIVKGTVKGTLAGDVIIIAEEGSVYAETTAAMITIAGIFEGNLNISNELVILPTGRCSGNVICKDLVIEAGGVLNAEVTCTVKSTTGPGIGIEKN